MPLLHWSSQASALLPGWRVNYNGMCCWRQCVMACSGTCCDAAVGSSWLFDSVHCSAIL
jgi:hypothetical protein